MVKQIDVLARATEREFRKGKIGGYLHVYSGQEAVATGILSALRKDDIVFSGYRDTPIPWPSAPTRRRRR